MRPLVVVLVIVAVAFVGWRLRVYYGHADKNGASEQAASPTEIRPERLPGLPYQLEPKLREAQSGGPVAFKAFIDWLKQYPEVRDPRLAWIELDYVVMVSPSDPVEAKKIFAQIKKRTSPDSPVMPRIRALAKTYE